MQAMPRMPRMPRMTCMTALTPLSKRVSTGSDSQLRGCGLICFCSLLSSADSRWRVMGGDDQTEPIQNHPARLEVAKRLANTSPGCRLRVAETSTRMKKSMSGPPSFPAGNEERPTSFPAGNVEQPFVACCRGCHIVHVACDLDPSGCHWMRSFVDVADCGGLDDMVAKACSSSTTPRASSRARECLSRGVCLFSQF
jgi:hypothetical protein